MVVDILLAIIVFLLLVILFLVCVCSARTKALEYYRIRLNAMVNNESLVAESKAILCEAYDITDHEFDRIIYILKKEGDI